MRTTRALILYESLFGNTAAVAQAVANGFRDASPGAEVVLRRLDERCDMPEDVDLLIVGAPTHFWGLTRSVTRAMELQYERRALPHLDPHGVDRRRATATTGMRDILASLPRAHGRSAAAFDTRMTGPLTGGAGREMARRLERAGYRVLAPPESFFVDAVAGPLHAGESERARAWGSALARSVDDDRDEPRESRRRIMNVISGPRVHVDGATPAAGDRVDQARPARRPRVDLTRVVTTAEVVVGAVLVARTFARRSGAPKAFVTMGPGGWVSMKSGTVAVRRGSRPWARPTPVSPRTSGHAPLWARVLSAVPLQALMR